MRRIKGKEMRKRVEVEVEERERRKWRGEGLGGEEGKKEEEGYFIKQKGKLRVT